MNIKAKEVGQENPYVPAHVPCVLLHGPDAGLGVPGLLPTDLFGHYVK